MNSISIRTPSGQGGQREAGAHTQVSVPDPWPNHRVHATAVKAGGMREGILHMAASLGIRVRPSRRMADVRRHVRKAGPGHPEFSDRGGNSERSDSAAFPVRTDCGGGFRPSADESKLETCTKLRLVRTSGFTTPNQSYRGMSAVPAQQLPRAQPQHCRVWYETPVPSFPFCIRASRQVACEGPMQMSRVSSADIPGSGSAAGPPTSALTRLREICDLATVGLHGQSGQDRRHACRHQKGISCASKAPRRLNRMRSSRTADSTMVRGSTTRHLRMSKWTAHPDSPASCPMNPEYPTSLLPSQPTRIPRRCRRCPCRLGISQSAARHQRHRPSTSDSSCRSAEHP